MMNIWRSIVVLWKIHESYWLFFGFTYASRWLLIVAHDYKALEIEAEKMKQIDKVNPRILRYLGYSAYL
jgi:hypothetical protein